MQLELKHLAPYLPYNLGIVHKFILDNTNNYQYWGTITLDGDFQLLDVLPDYSSFKPILRPLTDLAKEIEHNYKMFIPYIDFNYSIREVEMHISGQKNINQSPYWFIEKCFEYHFDVFGLIDKGLAIDINTLKSC